VIDGVTLALPVCLGFLFEVHHQLHGLDGEFAQIHGQGAALLGPNH